MHNNLFKIYKGIKNDDTKYEKMVKIYLIPISLILIISACLIPVFHFKLRNKSIELIFTKHTILELTHASTISNADVDLDGDIDILSSAADSQQLAYWENLRNGNFEKKIITADFPGLGVFLADLDVDSDLDVISLSHHPSEFACFENIS